MRILFTCFFLFLYALQLTAQNVGVNDDGGTPHNSAMLDVRSGNKGLLLPRVTLTGTNDNSTIGSPATSVLVYNLAAAGSGATAVVPGFYYWTGTAWSFFSGADSSFAWKLRGNAGIDTSVQFIGTTDNKPLLFRINNVGSGMLDNSMRNTSWGYGSLFNSTAGIDNSAFGCFSLGSNTTGNFNTAGGRSALLNNLSGNFNTAIGYCSLLKNTTGLSNSAFGYDALYFNTASFNTAVGYGALTSNTTGPNNTAVGFKALFLNVTGTSNSAFGYGALNNNTASNNTAIGSQALAFNTTGDGNTAVGFFALRTNATGANNSAFGYTALGNNTGSYNTAMGLQTLGANTTGQFNSAFGSEALAGNTTGSYNTAVGKDVMYFSANVNRNTGIGYQALIQTDGSADNTAIGYQALYNNGSGSNITAIGSGANVASGSLSNATVIGAGAIVDASDKVRIGNTAVTSIGGQVNWTAFSDGRFKTDIQENVPGIAFIKKLRAVSYIVDTKALDDRLQQMNAAAAPGAKMVRNVSNVHEQPAAPQPVSPAQRQSGFIAQEVEKAANDLGYRFSGVDVPKDAQGLYGLRYADFVVPMVKAMQEQQVIMETQEKKIQVLDKEMEQLKTQVAQLLKAAANHP